MAAFNLYCRMPFSKVNSRNKTIVAFAEKINRTPAALSMKMINLAWHDPNNPSSLRRGSKLDAAIWDEFFANREELIYESESAFAFYENESLIERADIGDDVAQMPEGKERQQLVRVRVNQAFFRRTVLSAYQERCCITGLASSALLNASHIIPWRETTRTHESEQRIMLERFARPRV